ncbi:Bifunctional solanapyrone synthase [Metarhizium anisopliae]|nr:Bifunctional solanapyrone synthase [Metarhizium anisopliae]
MGKLDPFIYINYAAQWQNPIASYGPASVDKLLETQRKYDPRRVFTRTVPGGFKLAHSVSRARALDVPIIRIPFGVNSYTWVILQPFVWNLLNFLPVPWSSYPDFVRYSHRTWHFLEKSRPTATLGPVWALVSPEEISLQIADPDMIGEIFARWRDFLVSMYLWQEADIHADIDGRRPDGANNRLLY